MMACGTRTLDARLGRDRDAEVDTGVEDVEYDSGLPDKPGPEVTYVVSFYRLGITTRDGTTSDTAWKDYGFDLDSVCTTADDSATSKGTCKRNPDAKSDVLADGNDCRDNNFGSQLIPLLKGIAPDTEPNLVAGIKKGSLTLAVHISDLAEKGEDGRAPASFLAVKGTGGAAKLDGTDTMDIDGTSVKDGDASKPNTVLVGGVKLVDGKRVWITKLDLLKLPAVFIAGATGAVPVHGARLELELDQVPVRGTLAGWVLVKDVQDLVGALLRGRSLCPGNPLYELVVNKNVPQAADMPIALPQDPSKDCEAISLAIGIELVKGNLGKVIEPSTPPKDPCTP